MGTGSHSVAEGVIRDRQERIDIMCREVVWKRKVSKIERLCNVRPNDFFRQLGRCYQSSRPGKEHTFVFDDSHHNTSILRDTLPFLLNDATVRWLSLERTEWISCYLTLWNQYSVLRGQASSLQMRCHLTLKLFSIFCGHLTACPRIDSCQ